MVHVAWQVGATVLRCNSICYDPWYREIAELLGGWSRNGGKVFLMLADAGCSHTIASWHSRLDAVDALYSVIVVAALLLL